MKGRTVYGSFDAADPCSPISAVTLEFAALDCVVQWRRCGLTADYLAGYFGYHFTERNVARSVLSTVLNELVENAVKFSADKSQRVRLRVWHLGDSMRIDVGNATDGRGAEALAAHLSKLAGQDLERWFVETVERSDGAEGSGIGLLTLVKDYNARLAARVTPREGEDALFDVVVQVTIRDDEIQPLR